jgi:hypothetical protein
MPILVKYKDNTIGYVPDDKLQALLEGNLIISFQRSGKWVDLSKDPLRGQGSNTKYDGYNRRKRW